MKYYDYAATSPLYPEVQLTLEKSYAQDFANPNAMHILGQNLREEIEEIRLNFLRLLKAKNDDAFYFTSCATESNNTIIKGLEFHKDDVIFYNPSEHSSLTAPIKEIAQKENLTLVELKNNTDGSLDFLFLEEKIKEFSSRIKLIALTSVNNQTGSLLDVDHVSKVIKDVIKNPLRLHFHIDAVQHFGKIPLFDLNLVDSASFSAHKIAGPKGIGGLYIKRQIKINPLMSGGGQEKGMRSGTESIALIKAFYNASEISVKNLASQQQKIAKIKNILKSELENSIPEIISPFTQTSDYIYSFILPGISSDILIRHLELKKIFISTTSACSSRIKGFNPSLMSLGIKEENHKNFLRISFGFLNSSEEALEVASEIIKTWHDLKKIKGKK